ncbi:FAD-dependent oxidoreductase [Rhodococcus oxybenzonivorans]|jgi:NADPH-dependent 2,4-dienoyl-CoA reductase/sulfur reductase-like enzyme|uniref:NAD(P)/FAD-dependent oxidoreductase n=1 Tax=Rhodococcus TaxID=1827 RepID=UPI001320152C|nr:MULTISPECIES: FAD-dependent oxidoreductase [Rhodococcus]MDV7354075.1 FAD-dependent oxidoreductase [Rhodococcus oxybenzonivorans]QHE71235.1 Ferredoxin reductase [Rhodococcus sp. WAY2]
MKSIAVIGASLSGLSAARALRAQGFEGELNIVGAERNRPYDRPPLSKEYLAGDIDETCLTLEPEGEDLQANWMLGLSATNLDAGTRSVTLSDGSQLAADGFVLATGSRARAWPDTEHLAGVHVLRTIDDADRLRAELVPGATLVVIGAGFIGAEVASTARKLGLDVTVVEAAPSPLIGALGPQLGSAVARLHGDNGTRLHCGVGVAGLTGAHRVTGVDLVDGRHLPADVVVVGIGGIPNTEWLAGSGIELGNGVLCDRGGTTSIPGVVAVGDCAAWMDTSGAHRRVEHWTGASERPAIAVSSLLSGEYQGQQVKPPYFWSDQYGSRIQFAGIAGPDTEFTIEEGSLEAGSFLAVYRRDGQPVAVLGVDQVRLFTRWRRQLCALPAPL